MIYPQLKEIFNYQEYSPKLVTSGQPTEVEFKLIADAGFQVVINLAQTDSPRAIENEAELVESENMRYLSIPVDFKQPETAKFTEFCETLEKYQGQNTYVHCAYNWRVSAFTFLFHTLILKQDRQSALDRMHQVWTPDATWSEYIKSIESLYNNKTETKN